MRRDGRGALLLNACAQALTFAAMLLPVVLGKFEATAGLLVVAAVSGIVAPTVTLGFAGVAPGLRGRASVAAAVRVAVVGVVSASSAFAAAGAVAVIANPADEGRLALLWIGAMILTTGGYGLALAGFVRRSDIVGLARTRLTYGALLFLLTGVAVVLPSGRFGLVAATVAAMTVALTGALVRLRVAARRILSQRIGRRVAFAYVRRALPAGGAVALSALAAQGAALSVAVLPAALGGLWGSALRLSGGFATVGQQIFAPMFDAHVGRAARSRTNPRTPIVRAVGAGTALGLFGAVVTAASLVVGALISEAPAPSWWLLTAAGLYILAQSVLSVVERFVLTLGARRIMLGWAAVKFTFVLLALLATREEALIWALAGAEALTTLAFLALLPTAWRRRRGRTAGSR